MAQPEHVRLDDQLRDSNAPGVSTPEPTTGQKPDVMRLESDEVPFTDPTTQTVHKTYTVAVKAATVDLASTAATTIDDDNVTITSVTYTPAGNQAAPSSSNSRVYVLAGSEGTVASYTFSSLSAAFATGVPVSLVLGVTSIKEAETLNLATTHAGTSGAADPGGVLTVTYTY